jgi:tetratricopeptide (TPR) repeat protein
VAGHPDVVTYKSSLARCYNRLGISLRHLQRLDEALGSYQKARETWELLVSSNPSVTDYRSDLAGVINNMANIQQVKGMKEEALGSYREAFKNNEVAAAANPGVLRYQNGLAGCLNAIGMLEVSLGRTNVALQTFEQLRTRMQEALAKNPANIDATRWLSVAWHNTADTFMSMSRPAEAADAYRQAIQYRTKVVQAFPGSKSQLRTLGEEYLDLASAQRALGHPDFAATTLWEHRELFSGDPEALHKLAGALAECLPKDARTSRHGDHSSENQVPVEQIAKRAMDALRQAVAAGYHDADALRRDASLAPLAMRAEFQVLVGDLAFPADPFSHQP